MSQLFIVYCFTPSVCVGHVPFCSYFVLWCAATSSREELSFLERLKEIINVSSSYSPRPKVQCGHNQRHSSRGQGGGSHLPCARSGRIQSRLAAGGHSDNSGKIHFFFKIYLIINCYSIYYSFRASKTMSSRRIIGSASRTRKSAFGSCVSRMWRSK